MSRFAPGQDVVCVKAMSQDELMSAPLVEGKDYKVTSTGSCCFKYCVTVGIFITMPEGAAGMYCAKCNREIKHGEELAFADHYFAPLEEIEREESLVMQEFYKILEPELV